jgi:DivIVA domain-containing protein
MPLLPEDVTSAGFRRCRRGYDPDQVDALLDLIRADYTAALQRIARGTAAGPAAGAGEPSYDRLGREVSTIARVVQEHAEQLRHEAEQEAQRIRDEAAREARQLSAFIAQRRKELSGRVAELERLVAALRAQTQGWPADADPSITARSLHRTHNGAAGRLNDEEPPHPDA